MATQTTGTTQEPTATGQDVRIAALAGIVKTAVEEATNNQTIQLTLSIKELQLGLNRIEERMRTLEALVASNKKTITKKADAKEPPTETATAEDNAVAVAETTNAQTAPEFINNTARYFKQRYQQDAAFREKYLSDDIKAKIDNDNAFLNSLRTAKGGEKSDTEKLKAYSSYVWNEISKPKTPTNEGLLKVYQDEFKQAKAAHDSANKPAQLAAEANTPK